MCRLRATHLSVLFAFAQLRASCTSRRRRILSILLRGDGSTSRLSTAPTGQGRGADHVFWDILDTLFFTRYRASISYRNSRSCSSRWRRRRRRPVCSTSESRADGPCALTLPRSLLEWALGIGFCHRLCGRHRRGSRVWWLRPIGRRRRPVVTPGANRFKYIGFGLLTSPTVFLFPGQKIVRPQIPTMRPPFLVPWLISRISFGRGPFSRTCRCVWVAIALSRSSVPLALTKWKDVTVTSVR